MAGDGQEGLARRGRLRKSILSLLEKNVYIRKNFDWRTGGPVAPPCFAVVGVPEARSVDVFIWRMYVGKY